jgi:hypothetical protein
LADILLSKTFNSEAEAQAYFDDDVVDLGIASGTDLDFSLALTDDPAGDSFSTDLAFGPQLQPAPEPSTWMMMGVGLLSLCWKVRSHRKVLVQAWEC